MFFDSKMRLNMHEKLMTLGAKKVYWQPPMNTTLEFPCIVYARTIQNALYANSQPYLMTHGITVTLIHQDIDKLLDWQNELLKLYPTARWQNDSTSDGLQQSQYQIQFL